MEDAYWQMGWHAWVDGKSFRSCPFFDGYEREAWMAGYDAARAKASLAGR